MVSAAGCSHPSHRPVCHCLGVTEGEIRHAIDACDLATVRQVSHACGAGSGCTACHRHIKRYLHEAAQRRLAEQHQSAGEPVLGFA